MVHKLRRVLLCFAIAALSVAVHPSRVRADRRDEIAAQLQSIDKKIADAEAMQAAINKSPDDYADVPQTLNVLADTLAKLRAQKADLTRELGRALVPAPVKPTPAPAPVRPATPPAAAATGSADGHDFSGGEMRANVAGLIGFVVPQLRRGSGAIPLKAVTSAMRLGDLGVPQDVVDGVDARGDISFSDGQGVNQGERLQKTIPLKYGLSATMTMAPTVSGSVSLAGDAGFKVSEIKGLSMTVSIIPVPLRVRAVSILPDAIQIKTSFLGLPHTITIDLTKNPVPSSEAR